jgi:hypothetical protein
MISKISPFANFKILSVLGELSRTLLILDTEKAQKSLGRP